MSDERTELKLTVSGQLVTNPHKQRDDGKYKAMVTFNPEFVEQKKIDKYIKTLEELEVQAIKEKFNGKKIKLEHHVMSFGDDEEFENTFGYNFVSLNNKKIFKFCKLINGKLVEVDDEEAEKLFYAGAIVAVALTVWAMASKTTAEGNKIPAQVNSSPKGTLVFLSHADKLGNSEATDEDFDGYESTENDDDFDDGSFQ